MVHLLRPRLALDAMEGFPMASETTPRPSRDEGRQILAHVGETWGERFGLTAGG